MTAYLLDTNIISEIMRRPNGVASQIYRTKQPGDLCTSVIVAGELSFGAAKDGQTHFRTRVAEVLANFVIHPIQSPADQIYGRIRAGIERRGTPIGANDLWIAAHALALDCVLVTANVSEFSRVPDLRVENWLSG